MPSSLEQLIERWEAEHKSNQRRTLQARSPRKQRGLHNATGKEYQRYVEPMAKKVVVKNQPRIARKLRLIEDRSGVDRLLSQLESFAV